MNSPRENNVGWVLNSPYEEPNQYWELDDYGRATEKVINGRRRDSAELVPVPRAESNLFKQPDPDIEPYRTINEIRIEVGKWREKGYPNVGRETIDLLEHFSDDSREIRERPFFCQVESLETFIWLEEVGKSLKGEDQAKWEAIHEKVSETSARWNNGVQRRAFKMATGTGKTKAMAMLLTWLAVCRQNHDVLVIAPNTTIREQLRSLKNLIEDNCPKKYIDYVRKLKITTLNFQAFQTRETSGFEDKPAKVVLEVIGENALREETPEEMLHRLLKDHIRGRKFVVVNDEAHHCRAGEKKESGEDSKETKERLLWFSAVDTLNRSGLLDFVLDFSATPMYLTKPKDLESAVFPWTITDYPLIEALEAGLVKIPRVPIDDDSSSQDENAKVARNIYENTPNKELSLGHLPSSVGHFLNALVSNHEKNAVQWRNEQKIEPVFIVVANSIQNAIVLYQHIAGYKDNNGEWVSGEFECFSNINSDLGGPKEKPPTILVTSRIDDPAEKSSGDENKGLDQQIEIHAPDLVKVRGKRSQFKELIREIFLSVGKRGEAGEHIKCVVSVSMLTEGWDTKTVTSIYGFRAFSSSLLCEQVVGRALRRTDLNFNGDNKLSECYADIFGIPFEFMRDRGGKPSDPLFEVSLVKDREKDFHMSFPNVESYKWNLPTTRFKLDPSKVIHFELPNFTTRRVRIGGAIGDTSEVPVSEAQGSKNGRFVLASVCTDLYLNNRNENNQEAIQPLSKRSLFRQFLTAVDEWWQHPEVTVDDSNMTVNQKNEPSDETRSAAEAVLKALVESEGNDRKALEPNFGVPNPLSTKYFHTYRTASTKIEPTNKSVINIAVCDSESEREVAKALDQYRRISRWVRNDRLGWTIPWYDEQKFRWRKYLPDFVAEVDDWNGTTLHLVIEFKGLEKHTDDVKRGHAQKYWVPALNDSDDASCKGVWKYVYIQSSKQGNKLREQIMHSLQAEVECSIC